MAESEKILLRASLVILRQDRKILLPIKKLKIGAGLRNGYGGGIEVGEGPDDATVRELEEEAGITALVENLQRVGVIDFHNITEQGVEFTCRVFVSFLQHWQGKPKEGPEMGAPEWFDEADMPLKEMMPADRYWLPVLLEGRIIYAQAWYGPKQQSLRQPTSITDISREELGRLWR